MISGLIHFYTFVLKYCIIRQLEFIWFVQVRSRSALKRKLRIFPLVEKFAVETIDCGKYLRHHLYFINTEINCKITSFPCGIMLMKS